MTESVQSITDAPLKHSAEQRERMVKYSVAMLFRILCFAAAIVVGVVYETWWSMVLVAFAVIVPYIAVVDANSIGKRYSSTRSAAPQNTAEITSTVGEDEHTQWWEDTAAFNRPGASTTEHTVISGELDTPEIGPAEDPQPVRER